MIEFENEIYFIDKIIKITKIKQYKNYHNNISFFDIICVNTDYRYKYKTKEEAEKMHNKLINNLKLKCESVNF